MNKKLAIILSLIVFISLLSFAFLYIFQRLQGVEIKVNQLSSAPQKTSEATTSAVSPQTDTCGESCKAEIQKQVADAVASITPVVQKIQTTKSTPVKEGGITYIPMGTTYQSTSTDWYTIDDTATYIDLANDYGANATVSWEASLKVDHGNGQAFVRLWDDTNKIAVDGSEMSTVNNADYQLVTTGKIPFWKGRNLYKVQIKSLNSFVVSYTGGKIRIAY